MKSAIEEIFDGRFGKPDPDMNEECRKAAHRTPEKEAALLKLLKDNSEALKAYEEYVEAENEISCMGAVNYYKSGFRHGFRLALDIMGEND